MVVGLRKRKSTRQSRVMRNDKNPASWPVRRFVWRTEVWIVPQPFEQLWEFPPLCGRQRSG